MTVPEEIVPGAMVFHRKVTYSQRGLSLETSDYFLSIQSVKKTVSSSNF